MPAEFNKPHLSFIEKFSSSLDYHYPNRPAIQHRIVDRNRSTHGNRLLEQLNGIRNEFELAEDVELPENVVRENVIYVEFISEWGYDLNKLNTDAKKPKFHILNIKEEKTGEDQKRYKVLAYIIAYS